MENNISCRHTNLFKLIIILCYNMYNNIIWFLDHKTGQVTKMQIMWNHSSPDGYILSVANIEGVLKCFFLE